MKPKFVTSTQQSDSDKLMNQNQLVGNNIRCFRDRMNLTQEQLGHYLGISREEVNYYENGKRNIPSLVITKTAELFGIGEYDLYEENADLLETNLAFAFRANLCNDDLVHIAEFQKIVRNYIKMVSVLGHESPTT